MEIQLVAGNAVVHVHSLLGEHHLVGGETGVGERHGLGILQGDFRRGRQGGRLGRCLGGAGGQVIHFLLHDGAVGGLDPILIFGAVRGKFDLIDELAVVEFEVALEHLGAGRIHTGVGAGQILCLLLANGAALGDGVDREHRGGAQAGQGSQENEGADKGFLGGFKITLYLFHSGTLLRLICL